MKILLTLFAIFSLQSSVAQIRYVTLGNGDLVELKPTDIVEIVGVTNGTNDGINFQRENQKGSFSVIFNSKVENLQHQSIKHIFTGLVTASFNGRTDSAITIKITPFVATNVTTSNPIIVPPTSANDSKWNVQLQVSTDLSNWEDVVPGEFLGSDKARFFRVKTTTGSEE